MTSSSETSAAHNPYLGHAYRFWLGVGLALATVVCGSIGVWQYEHAYHPEAHHAFGPLYAALQMLVLHTPHFERGVNPWIEAGRWLGASFLVSTAVSVFWSYLRRGEQLVWLLRFRGHQVVCGLGQKGYEIVNSLLKTRPDAQVVVIDPQPDPQLVERLRPYRVVLVPGDATEATSLDRARVKDAAEVFVVTPSDDTNVAIAAAVRAKLGGRSEGTVPCRVHLADIDLREALERWHEATGAERSGCRLHFFDVFDDEARRLLRERPLDGPGLAADSPEQVHAVILGFGRMARSLALRALKSGHFANGKPLRLSVVTRDADRERERFLFRYPALAGGAWAERLGLCRLEFQEGEAQSLRTRERVLGWLAEPGTRVHVFVCLDDDARAVEVALRLNAARPDPKQGSVFVRVRTRGSLGEILEAAFPGEASIVSFGMVEDGCCRRAHTPTEGDELARAVHEGFVADRSQDPGRTPASDPALRAWDDLREDFRESNRQQADHIATKLRAYGYELAPESDSRPAEAAFSTAVVEGMARMEHARWNMERLLAGWRPGTPTDKPRRISAHLVGWEGLPADIQDYDRAAVSRIPGLPLRLGDGSCSLRAKVVRRAPVGGGV